MVNDPRCEHADPTIMMAQDTRTGPQSSRYFMVVDTIIYGLLFLSNPIIC